MQDKTQVFPLSKVDYVRTRLTHSLESSSVGRSLGTLVGEQLIARTPRGLRPLGLRRHRGGRCLGHDIGNPPFGHSGETPSATGPHGDLRRPRVATLRGSQQEDFLSFEGNAQGFRCSPACRTATTPAVCSSRAPPWRLHQVPPRVLPRRQPLRRRERAQAGLHRGGPGAFERCRDRRLLRRHDGYAIWRPPAGLPGRARTTSATRDRHRGRLRLGRLSYAEAQELFWPLVADPVREGRRSSRSAVPARRSSSCARRSSTTSSSRWSGSSWIWRATCWPAATMPAARCHPGRPRCRPHRRCQRPHLLRAGGRGDRDRRLPVIGDLLERFVETVDDLASTVPTPCRAAG